jgi:hypothetical protein
MALSEGSIFLQNYQWLERLGSYFNSQSHFAKPGGCAADPGVEAVDQIREPRLAQAGGSFMAG